LDTINPIDISKGIEIPMRDGGKGDARRPLAVPEEQFESNWDTIFKKKPESPCQPLCKPSVCDCVEKEKK